VSAYLNEEGKKDIIKSSMMIAAADGDIDATEISMVENFGKALELKPAQVKAIIESVK
jgi:tellurite resistance protein